MSKTAKIIWTIIAVVALFFIGGFVGNLPPSDAKGPICLIVFAAFIGGLIAIWKKKKEE